MNEHQPQGSGPMTTIAIGDLVRASAVSLSR